uniref:Uncharacterized protein n=1 Tax=Setaria viridis TaxID=4556 RepID=A0A4U6UE67_SETVI|nr:LOW QUALITY PROTEIN: hypothetical protein SEVIR_5G006700v2 [Setaria viridis]
MASCLELLQVRDAISTRPARERYANRVTGLVSRMPFDGVDDDVGHGIHGAVAVPAGDVGAEEPWAAGRQRGERPDVEGVDGVEQALLRGQYVRARGGVVVHRRRSPLWCRDGRRLPEAAGQVVLHVCAVERRPSPVQVEIISVPSSPLVAACHLRRSSPRVQVVLFGPHQNSMLTVGGAGGHWRACRSMIADTSPALGHDGSEQAGGVLRRHEPRHDAGRGVLRLDRGDPEGVAEVAAVGEQTPPPPSGREAVVADEGDGEGEVLGGDVEVAAALGAAEVAEVGGHEAAEAVEGSVGDVPPPLAAPAHPELPLRRRELQLLLLVVEEQADGVEDDVGDGVCEAHVEPAGAEAAVQPRHLLEGQTPRRLRVEAVDEPPLDLVGARDRGLVDGRPLPLLAVEARQAAATGEAFRFRGRRRHGADGLPQHGDKAVEGTRRHAGHGPGVEDAVWQLAGALYRREGGVGDDVGHGVHGAVAVPGDEDGAEEPGAPGHYGERLDVHGVDGVEQAQLQRHDALARGGVVVHVHRRLERRRPLEAAGKLGLHVRAVVERQVGDEAELMMMPCAFDQDCGDEVAFFPNVGRQQERAIVASSAGGAVGAVGELHADRRRPLACQKVPDFPDVVGGEWTPQLGQDGGERVGGVLRRHDPRQDGGRGLGPRVVRELRLLEQQADSVEDDVGDGVGEAQAVAARTHDSSSGISASGSRLAACLYNSSMLRLLPMSSSAVGGRFSFCPWEQEKLTGAAVGRP